MNEYEALGFLYSKVKVAPSYYDDYVKAMKVITSLVSKYTEKCVVKEGERNDTRRSREAMERNN